MSIEQATEIIWLLWAIMLLGAFRTGIAFSNVAKEWTD